MSETPKQEPGGMRTWLRVVLVVSLALNLLMVGAIGGAVLRHGLWGGHHSPRLEMAGGPMTRALSPEDRRALGRKIRAEYREGRPARAEHRELMRGLVADLKAVPYDAEAVRARMERIHALFGERLAIGQALLLEHLAGLSDAERAAYAERLQQSFRR